MRRIIFGALLSVLLAGPCFAQVFPKEWSTEGVKTNPLAATTLCEYVNENVTYESHVLHFVVASTVATIVIFEQMDSANTTVLRAQSFPLASNSPYDSMKLFLTIDVGERWRVRTSGAVVGSLQCSLFVE